MKTLLIILTLAICSNAYSQSTIEEVDLFVRVYDLDGRKIGKGKLVSITKDTIRLIFRNRKTGIATPNVGRIRTKRSVGNNVLVGAAGGGLALAAIGVVSADNSSGFFTYTESEGAAVGMVMGAPIGAVVGGISAIFKNTRSFEINGDSGKLETFKSAVLNSRKR